MGYEHQELHELMAGYALGALEAEERSEVERHLDDGCPACESELRAWTRQLEELAAAAPPVEPSELTRARVLRAVERTAAAERAGRAPLAASLAAAAGLVLLLGWSLWSQAGLRRELARLAAADAAVRSELVLVRSELDQARGELRRAALATRIAASPGMRAVTLLASADLDAASAHTLIDPDRRQAVFYAANVPPAEAGSTYQLWFIADGQPVSGGTFEPDPEGSVALIVDQVADLATIQAWAVTIEPAGGVPQPTGPMVLKS